MAYGEDLASRVRAVLPPAAAVTERQMFGGLAFLLGGRTFCGIVKDALMARLGPEGADRALDQPHVRPMDFTGRPMKGMVFVGLEGCAVTRYANGSTPPATHAACRPNPPRPHARAGLHPEIRCVSSKFQDLSRRTEAW
ncbi:MAG: TfoX/Sxy family protein [Trebonia sp.]